MTLYDGKIVPTKHAKVRFKERDIDLFYVITQLRFIEYSEGQHRWHIFSTHYTVIYEDRHNMRFIVTLWKEC